MTHTGIETGNADTDQLYDLSQDIGQIRNLAAERKELVDRMRHRLQQIRQSQRTRP